MTDYDLTLVGLYAMGGCNADIGTFQFSLPPGPSPDELPPTGSRIDGVLFDCDDAAHSLSIGNQQILGKGILAANSSFLGRQETLFFKLGEPFFYEDAFNTFYVVPQATPTPLPGSPNGNGNGNSVLPRRTRGLPNAQQTSLGEISRVQQQYYLPRKDAADETAAVLAADLTTSIVATTPEGASLAAKALLPASKVAGSVVPSAPVALYYQFLEHRHPFVCPLIDALYNGGVDALMARPLQFMLIDYFQDTYAPHSSVLVPLPVAMFDFTYRGAYSPYNWELFFHIPLLIATRLMQNQKFEDAQRWFHYIFNPTDGTNLPVPQKYWVTQPFFLRTAAGYAKEQITRLLELLDLGSSDPELAAQVRAWRKTPFNPHLIARLRTVAYQKTTVMKYLDNLIAWGDQLFRQDTLETINEATQIYVLAAEILGRRPEQIPLRINVAPETYDSLAPQLDDFSNAMVGVENLVPPNVFDPPIQSGGTHPAEAALYFGIPNNAKLMTYWDTVEDRLFKVRHCLNIEGVFQQLPLFEPPIDPGLLVKAAAAGVDLSSVLGDINAPAPVYRFSVLMQRATELCAEVRALGQAMLTVLEKRDAETLSNLRSSQEIQLLSAVRGVKALQQQEADKTHESLQQNRATVQMRAEYYKGLGPLSPGESNHLSLMNQVASLELTQSAFAIVASVLSIIPEVKVGSPTTMGASIGGENLSGATALAKEEMGHAASGLSNTASATSTLASHNRRADDWAFQGRHADSEVTQVDKQIEAADFRRQITQQELDNHDLQIANAQAVDEFFHDKFTNEELFDWMAGQTAAIYFQGYQLAYDVAKRAERAFRYELGLTDSSYIRFGYWDGVRQGLLAGERLTHDLKQLEMAYLEQNRRELEITKHVSLLLLDPVQLINLRENGECLIDVPEWLFDLDFPGHFMRRIKTVRLTIPCVTGPYTSVNATLTLNANRTRLTAQGSSYPRTGPNDTRFKDNFATVQSIATTNGQNDGGLFQLDFRDERFLPFEGAGADSSWTLRMPRATNAFDFETITDVILTMQYTARDGGDELRQRAMGAVPAPPAADLVRLLSVAHDYPNEWYRFGHPLNVNAVTFTAAVDIEPDRFPYLYRNRVSGISQLSLVLRPAAGQDPNDFVGQTVTVTSPNGIVAALSLLPPASSGTGYPLPFAQQGVAGANAFGNWSLSTSIDPSTIDDIFLVMTYTIA